METEAVRGWTICQSSWPLVVTLQWTTYHIFDKYSFQCIVGRKFISQTRCARNITSEFHREHHFYDDSFIWPVDGNFRTSVLISSTLPVSWSGIQVLVGFMVMSDPRGEAGSLGQQPCMLDHPRCPCSCVSRCWPELLLLGLFPVTRLQHQSRVLWDPALSHLLLSSSWDLKSFQNLGHTMIGKVGLNWKKSHGYLICCINSRNFNTCL